MVFMLEAGFGHLVEIRFPVRTIQMFSRRRQWPLIGLKLKAQARLGSGDPRARMK
jgi:hypothetical protein